MMSKVSARSAELPLGDQYFLDSSSRISAFFEPSALDPEDPKKLVVPKEQSINKIGHALCQLDPVFREQTLANDKLQGLARDLGMHKDPLGK
jgi:phytanoyl-CoA hydroxylase